MRKPAEVFHPSEYLREELAERGWTAQELAARMDYDVRSVQMLVDGHAIDEKAAAALSRALGTSWELWVGLQMQWDGSLLQALGEAQA